MATDNDDGLQYFPQFNGLPKEIRLLIWEHALPAPRMVWVMQRETTRTVRDIVKDADEWIEEWQVDRTKIPGSCTIPRDGRSDEELLELLSEIEEWIMTCGYDIADDVQDILLPNFRSLFPTPSILLACRESYNIASKSYHRAFAHIDSPELPRNTFFDFTRDTLHIRDDIIYVEGQLESSYASDVIVYIDDESRKRVESLALSSKEWSSWRYDTYTNILARFPALRNLTIIVNYDHYHEAMHLDPVLYQPVDFDYLAPMWHDQYRQNRDEDIDIPVIKTMRGLGSILDETDREHIRNLHLRDWDLAEDWELPNIEYKIMISAEEKDFLDWIKEKHVQTVERALRRDGMVLANWMPVRERV